jgi:hypothetical protein
MKHILLLSSILGLILFGCTQATKTKVPAKIDSETAKPAPANNDKAEIQTLIRLMLKWADSKNEIELLPALSKDSICTGFDFDKLNQNIEKLRKTGYFANEFIDNYDQIIRTLDKKIKNNEFEKWNVYELPTFYFANDASPWCDCQDNLPWDNVEVRVIKLDTDKGELIWNWGKTDADTDQSWKDFAYKFRVVKVDGKWKISYLQGFDYKQSVK